MTRLIDADKITYTPSVPIAVISRIVNTGREEDARHLFHVSRADIDAQPTIDAVPVIRCEHCNHNHGDGFVDCELLPQMFGRMACENHCSLAEPKYDYCNGPYEEHDSLESEVIKSALASEKVYDPKGEPDVSEG